MQIWSFFGHQHVQNWASFLLELARIRCTTPLGGHEKPIIGIWSQGIDTLRLDIGIRPQNSDIVWPQNINVWPQNMDA